MTPPALMKAILQAPADLLWNGGIGTYVKAETESDADVGDRANDAVRVNGNQLRAKVIGEGGNLGVTQRGRIEFDLAGGRVNTDAWTTRPASTAPTTRSTSRSWSTRWSPRARSERRAHRPVAVDDRRSGAAGAQRQRGPERPDGHQPRQCGQPASRARQPDQGLAPRRGLNRELEALPSEKEIRRRTEVGIGLTSPELATLMAHVKLALKDELLATDLPDQEVFAARLPDYFPAEAARATSPPRSAPISCAARSSPRCWSTISSTPVGSPTPTGSPRTSASARSTRCAVTSPPTRSSGWARCGGRSGRPATRACPVAVTDRMTLDLRRLIDRAGRWLLNYRPQPLAVGAEINRFAAKVAALTPRMSEWLRGDDNGHRRQGSRRVQRAGCARRNWRTWWPRGSTSTACST